MIKLLRRFARRRWETMLWVVVLGFIGWRIWPQVAAAIGVTSGSTTAPPFQLTTLDGNAVTDQQLRGKVVLVNFWATWCPPCRVEMPGFQRAYEKFKDEGFVVLGVAMDAGGTDGVRQFITERQITYPIAMATSSAVRDFGGVRLLPTSFLIDRDGRIRHEVSGIFASVALDQAVRRLIDEPRDGAAAGGIRGAR